MLFESLILSFYPLGFIPRDGRGATGTSLTQVGEAARCKAGECHRAPIPPRGSDHSRKAIRVQVPSGSFNACQRRELAHGDMVRPGQDKTRGPLEKSGRE